MEIGLSRERQRAIVLDMLTDAKDEYKKYIEKAFKEYVASHIPNNTNSHFHHNCIYDNELRNLETKMIDINEFLKSYD